MKLDCLTKYLPEEIVRIILSFDEPFEASLIKPLIAPLKD
jgi:hypothetical protein